MNHDRRLELSVDAEKAILVGVILPDSKADPRDPLGELASLAATAGAQVVERVIQHRRDIDPSTFIGQGKAKEIAQLVELHQADVVLFDHDMSPNQLRDLEKICHCKILDRSELILDIFATRAQTHEAQLQVALAQLEYTYPRLRHMWSHLERIGAGAGAGVGARGPGEMQLEIDRRLVRTRVSELKGRLEEIQRRKSREVQTRKQLHFTVGIVGYTNAGKSTLFNSLTGAGTLVENKLFATLDTKTRRWSLGGAHGALLSDTVGFVRDLPHHLVASFKATLEEATHADLLLVVLDVSDPQAIQQLSSVQEVLTEIGCGEHPCMLLLNKTDAVESPDQLAFWQLSFPDALSISAKTGQGLVTLADRVRDQMLGPPLQLRLQTPLSDGKGLTFIEKFCYILERDYETLTDFVLLDCLTSERIVDQLVLHSPETRLLQRRPGENAAAWRSRALAVRELSEHLNPAIVKKPNSPESSGKETA